MTIDERLREADKIYKSKIMKDAIFTFYWLGKQTKTSDSKRKFINKIKFNHINGKTSIDIKRKVNKHQKKINLLGSTTNQPSIFKTKSWVKIIGHRGRVYGVITKSKLKRQC